MKRTKAVINHVGTILFEGVLEEDGTYQINIMVDNWSFDCLNKFIEYEIINGIDYIAGYTLEDLKIISDEHHINTNPHSKP